MNQQEAHSTPYGMRASVNGNQLLSKHQIYENNLNLIAFDLNHPIERVVFCAGI